jgi:glycosyltransferase involved in cell wall biosynthesis
MSQNLLPFETKETARFGLLSFKRWKMALLRRAQSSSMKRAEGLIFLTRYARAVVLAALGHPAKRTTVIPHGIEDRFFREPGPAIPLSEFGFSSPFEILYVSIVDVYKHQWQVVEAVGLLRRRGLPVELDLVGPAYPPALKRLRAAISKVDPAQSFVRYNGPVPFRELHTVYHQADAFVFASSCEAFANILLEAMAAGLAIACSGKGSMLDVLGDAGVYFDPERPEEIAEALQRLVEHDGLRSRLAREAYTRATRYSWERCAAATFSFIAECAGKGKTAGDLPAPKS